MTNKTKWDDIYFDPADPGSFSSKRNLDLSASRYGIENKNEPLSDYLHSNIVYNLHAPARRRFPRNPVVVDYPGQLFQIDLVDMAMYEKENQGFKYLLTCIDVFSKVADAIPLKSKSSKEITKAVEIIFQKRSPPETLQSDRGTEFKNKEFMQMCQEYGVKFFWTYNQDIKCSVVERFNRTIKGRMFRFFTARGSRRWIDVIDQLITGYNNAYHRSIRMAPNNVKDSNLEVVFHNLYGFTNRRDMILNQEYKKPRFKVGDWVRIKYDLSILEKSYLPNWSDMWFQIIKVSRAHSIPQFIIRDELGRQMNRVYYGHELRLVKRDLATARIEKILKKDHKKKRALVRWTNAPPELDQWIPLDEAMAQILPKLRNQS